MLLSTSGYSQRCEAEFTFKVESMVRLVTFANKSQGLNLSCQWNFGDGSFSKTKNPLHLYESPGSYLVCLTIINDENNCRDQFCAVVNVDVTPECKALFSFTNGENFNTVNFENKSINSTDSIMWDFGDGLTSYTLNPTHIYENTGTYNVCLTITNGNGCSDSICNLIIIDSITACSASINKIQNKLYLTAKPVGDSTNKQVTWNIDSSQIIEGFTLNHLFDSSGYYTLCLVIKDTITGCISSSCEQLLISEMKNTVVDFSLDKKYDSRVYPTPSKSIITIELLEFGETDYSLIITDLKGNKVKQYKTLIMPINQFDLSTLSKSMYFYYAIVDEKTVASGKILMF
ncbi:MAG: PKD repeat protein [Sphingobacteriales bacterium]|jgi:PKD repeat protein